MPPQAVNAAEGPRRAKCAVKGTYTPPARVISEEVEPSGWTQKAYLDVITKLLRKHHVQVAVIFEAIKNGTGYVSRDQVYELGHYDESRSLKGFTRPVNRFTEEAQEKGLLPDDAEDLLLPDYDPAIKGLQRARLLRADGGREARGGVEGPRGEGEGQQGVLT